jgi:RNA polymerase sigma-70 factor (ECF subfamily)
MPLPEVPPPDPEADAAAFEEWRSLLFGIAYRMLGSAADAEDVVQDACIRWLGRRDRAVESVRAYLVTDCDPPLSRPAQFGPGHPCHIRRTVVARAGRWSRRKRQPSRPTHCQWLSSCLLEELTPLERAAYLLHDIFGYSFEEVARSLGRSAAACRQLGSRARARIAQRRQRFDADLRRGRALTDRFLVACATGDLSGLLDMLADDVVVWTDGGGKVRAAMRPVVGPYRSSRFLLHVAKKVRGVPQDHRPQRATSHCLRRRRERGGRTRAGHSGRVHRGRPHRHESGQARRHLDARLRA